MVLMLTCSNPHKDRSFTAEKFTRLAQLCDLPPQQSDITVQGFPKSEKIFVILETNHVMIFFLRSPLQGVGTIPSRDI